ncbi:MAG: GIY-YIG nuclease family protein [Pseudomonadota bacterium]
MPDAGAQTAVGESRPARNAATKTPCAPGTGETVMTYTVYAIIDPRSQRPFYIGETKSLQRRTKQHLDGTDQISGLIVRQIKENGFVPHIVVLEMHDDEETALRAEIFWIETMLARGIDLTNSQAFTGYWDRTAKRAKETRKLASMKRLRSLANGRTAKRTRPKRQRPDADGWAPSEVKRLRGMQSNGIAIKAMARMLDRPVADIRQKLSNDLLS